MHLCIMACVICHIDISGGEATMTSPCCGVVAHSTCGIKWMLDYSYHSYVIPCINNACNQTIHHHYSAASSEHEYVQMEERITQLLQDAAFKEDLKGVKKAISLSRRAKNACMKLLGPMSRQFKQAVAPHITAFKELKKGFRRDFMNHSLRKNLQKENMKRGRIERALMSKYNINMRTYLCLMRRAKLYEYTRSLSRLFNRKFRIRF